MTWPEAVLAALGVLAAAEAVTVWAWRWRRRRMRGQADAALKKWAGENRP